MSRQCRYCSRCTVSRSQQPVRDTARHTGVPGPHEQGAGRGPDGWPRSPWVRSRGDPRQPYKRCHQVGNMDSPFTKLLISQEYQLKRREDYHPGLRLRPGVPVTTTETTLPWDPWPRTRWGVQTTVPQPRGFQGPSPLPGCRAPGRTDPQGQTSRSWGSRGTGDCADRFSFSTSRELGKPQRPVHGTQLHPCRPRWATCPAPASPLQPRDRAVCFPPTLGPIPACCWGPLHVPTLGTRGHA